MRSYAGLIGALLVSFCGLALADCGTDPVTTQRPAGFVALSSMAPEIVQDMRYATPHNFTGQVVAGYQAAACWLTRPAALALKTAATALHAQGWQLKVYDCYRPQRAVDQFMRWATNPDTSTRARYYPKRRKTQLVPQGYIARCSGHSRGSTVDVGLLPLNPSTPRLPRSACGTVDAQAAATGTGFDCFDPRSHSHSQQVDAKARQTRQTLLQAMQAAGFHNYAREWWHYTLDNEPYTDRYFNFPVVAPN